MNINVVKQVSACSAEPCLFICVDVGMSSTTTDHVSDIRDTAESAGNTTPDRTTGPTPTPSAPMRTRSRDADRPSPPGFNLPLFVPNSDVQELVEFLRNQNNAVQRFGPAGTPPIPPSPATPSAIPDPPPHLPSPPFRGWPVSGTLLFDTSTAQTVTPLPMPSLSLFNLSDPTTFPSLPAIPNPTLVFGGERPDTPTTIITEVSDPEPTLGGEQGRTERYAPPSTSSAPVVNPTPILPPPPPITEAERVRLERGKFPAGPSITLTPPPVTDSQDTPPFVPPHSVNLPTVADRTKYSPRFMKAFETFCYVFPPA